MSFEWAGGSNRSGGRPGRKKTWYRLLVLELGHKAKENAVMVYKSPKFFLPKAVAGDAWYFVVTLTLCRVLGHKPNEADDGYPEAMKGCGRCGRRSLQ
jgi:hypothetical protein